MVYKLFKFYDDRGELVVVKQCTEVHAHFYANFFNLEYEEAGELIKK